MNVLKSHLQSTVFTLLERKKSQREIERLTGVSRKTIRRYQALFEGRRAAAANSPMVTTGSEPEVQQTALAPSPQARPAPTARALPPRLTAQSGQIPIDGQTPPLPRPPAVDAPTEATSFNFARSASEPHRDWIEQQVRLKRNAQAIYQDLVDQFGFTASYQSVKRFVRALRHVDPEQFDRLEFAPGEEAQVDYGEGALTRDPKTGRYCAYR